MCSFFFVWRILSFKESDNGDTVLYSRYLVILISLMHTSNIITSICNGHTTKKTNYMMNYRISVSIWRPYLIVTLQSKNTRSTLCISIDIENI